MEWSELREEKGKERRDKYGEGIKGVRTTEE